MPTGNAGSTGLERKGYMYYKYLDEIVRAWVPTLEASSM